MNVHLDTHVALWLAAGETRRLRPIAKQLHRASLQLSPLVVVEMEVLREIGRIREQVNSVVDLLKSEHGVEIAAGSAEDIAKHARSLGWTRDPFDRLIVAHSLANRTPLLTADATILDYCPTARWG